MQKHHSFYCLFPSWTSGERRIQKPASPTLHYMSPNFIFNFPKTEERIQIKNWFLRTECLEYSILLKGASMQSSNLVMIHGKAGFQRAKYSQVMTQKKSASCINPLQLYHTWCAFTDHSYWLYRYEQDSKDTSNGNSVQMRSRKLNSILLLSAAKSSAEIWLWIFMDVNDVEEGRTHLHFQIPGRLLQG